MQVSGFQIIYVKWRSMLRAKQRFSISSIVSRVDRILRNIYSYLYTLKAWRRYLHISGSVC
jgi:hypothetical protein